VGRDKPGSVPGQVIHGQKKTHEGEKCSLTDHRLENLGHQGFGIIDRPLQKLEGRIQGRKRLSTGEPEDGGKTIFALSINRGRVLFRPHAAKKYMLLTVVGSSERGRGLPGLSRRGNIKYLLNG